jgi:hypothetical protein
VGQPRAHLSATIERFLKNLRRDTNRRRTRGTSFKTTQFGPILAFLPIVAAPIIFAPAPTSTSPPIFRRTTFCVPIVTVGIEGGSVYRAAMTSESGLGRVKRFAAKA